MRRINIACSWKRFKDKHFSKEGDSLYRSLDRFVPKSGGRRLQTNDINVNAVCMGFNPIQKRE